MAKTISVVSAHAAPIEPTHAIQLLITLLLLAATVSLASAEEIPAPPYLVGRSEALVIGIAYDEASLSPVAPVGLAATAGASGQIVMYRGSGAYGLPDFDSTFLALDLDGFDSASGYKGRWMLSGLYSPVAVATAVARHFGYPAREGTTRVERDGLRVTATGTTAGRQLVRVDMLLKPEPCLRGSGMAHGLTRDAGTGAIQLIQIPHVGEWCPAESIEVEITAPPGDAFAQIGPLKVLWGGYSLGSFAWSAPVVAR